MASFGPHSRKLGSIFIFLLPLIMSTVSSQPGSSSNTPATISSVLPLPWLPTHQAEQRTSSKRVRERMLHFSPDFQDELSGIQQLLVEERNSPIETELLGIDEPIHSAGTSGRNIKLSPEPMKGSWIKESPGRNQEIPYPGKIPKTSTRNPILDKGRTSEDGRNEIIPDRSEKPISSKSPSDSSDDGSIMGNRQGNNLPLPSINPINAGEDTPKTKDCKEIQFEGSPPARAATGSSSVDENDKKGLDSLPGWQRTIPERTSNLEEQHLQSPLISPYATSLFKPLKEDSEELLTPLLDSGIVTVVGIFLVSILTFAAALVSQGPEVNYVHPYSQPRIIDPVQTSWNPSFHPNFYSPGMRRQSVHFPHRPRPTPVIWF